MKIKLCNVCKSDQWETEFLSMPALPETLIGQKTAVMRKFVSFVTIAIYTLVLRVLRSSVTVFLNIQEAQESIPRNRFQGIDSASLGSLSPYLPYL